MTTQNPLSNQEVERRKQVRASLSGWWDRLTQLSTAWDIEACKHLIVLNAAGFAGVSTLLAGNKPIEPHWVGPATLLGYGIAVILAILNMYLAGVSFGLMAGEVKRRMAKVFDPSEDLTGIFNDTTDGKWCCLIGQGCGWTSAILAAASTITLGISLARL